MIALTDNDCVALLLACECLLRDTARKQKLAKKRDDLNAVARLETLAEAVESARRKVLAMRGASS